MILFFNNERARNRLPSQPDAQTMVTRSPGSGSGDRRFFLRADKADARLSPTPKPL